MIHEFKNDDHHWKWYHLESHNQEEIKQIIDENKECKDWLDHIEKNQTNKLTVDTTRYEKPFVNGSLIYQQNTINREEHDLFHFYLTERILLTVDLDFSKLKNTEIKKIINQMEHSQNSVEAFSIILGALTNNYLKKIDDFEIKLNDLIWEIQKRNNIHTLDKIYERRHELLICRNLMIPIQEIMLGLEEGFGEEILRYPQIRQRYVKMKRCLTLIKEYQQEIDTMINVEEVISSHRGNSIMKTLTVITTLFTPISAWGALWGMNFKNMPELSWHYGYLLALGVILLNTVFLYFFLFKRGWTGDILQGKEKHSLFK
ncbi:magnesium transporter CorA family protein [Heyndrickxia acidiproducens]|uniref:magnesium transporter CorA family protein n=1 Tax=Heyndrickxia acidiproducens TaxID=1121084 RepID=UPI0003789161|nr:magnesium transporter CorA family protein [Heyndrickxia acidiproducens]